MFSQITEKEVFVVAETFSKLLVSSFASITSTSPNKRLTLGNLFRWDLTTAQSIIERNLRKLGPTRTWHGQM